MKGTSAADSLPLGPRVLVVEDNLTNQKLAVQVLLREGYSIATAGNGKEALELIAKERFAAVLMDVQMPEMDGFEATVLIRQQEQSTGGHLPIIAMTAYAMQGDRERCLASGMDDYLSKPVGVDELVVTIARYTGRPARTSLEKKDPSMDVLDFEKLSQQFNHDRRILKKIAAIFSADWPESIAQAQQAIEHQNAEDLARAAHSLGGGISIFHAGSALEAARRLEQLAQEGNLGAAPEACLVLRQELARIDAALAELLNR